MKVPALCIPFGFLLMSFCATAPSLSTDWKKMTVTGDFLTEGLSTGDIDGDGIPDLVAGAFWFRGPEFNEARPYRPGHAQPVDTYMEDSFLSWVDDLNGDRKNDILMVGRPGHETTIYLNPGATGEWTSHRILEETSTESPIYIDLDGDGKKELVCMQGGRFGYAKRDASDVTKPWTFIPISEKRTDSPFIHGLGVGDLNGDGRLDVIEKEGWFEQPAKITDPWSYHPYAFAKAGGAQMLVFDVDGDGDADIVTSLNGHGYGLAWFENRFNQDGKVDFIRHEILSEDGAQKGPGGLQVSELHAMEAGDLDGDGRVDFVTGKRYWAHNGNDPGASDPALTVIFLNKKDGDSVRWEPHVLDENFGVGCQIAVGDVTGDGKPDIAIGCKKGVVVFAPN
ncbi:MAG: repeat-containing protein [Akkermansiaceae bacterium]|nr:repeat-containing protein [Akkermansiaceae bacterium]